MKGKIRIGFIFFLMVIMWNLSQICHAATRDCVEFTNHPYYTPMYEFVDSLDANFEYSDIEWCLMDYYLEADVPSSTQKAKFWYGWPSNHTSLPDVKFGGYNFCAVPASELTNYCDYTLSNDNSHPACTEEGFVPFRINFIKDGTKYVGWGCHKDKVVGENVEDFYMTIHEGTIIDLFAELQKKNKTYNDNYKCEMGSSDYNEIIASWTDQAKCKLTPILDRVGEFTVNIRNEDNKLVYRFNFEVTGTVNIESLNEKLDKENYAYKSPEGCNEDDLLQKDGAIFCHNRHNDELTCDEGYNLIPVGVKLSNNITTDVYTCRKSLYNEPTSEPHGPRLDYTSLCSSNKGVKSAAKIVGYVLSIGKWLVAFIIIIFGVIDFSKAVISSDEKAISKAASKLLKRFIAGVIAVVIPTLPIVILNIIQVSQGIEKSSNFAACTKCIFDPFNSCD